MMQENRNGYTNKTKNEKYIQRITGLSDIEGHRYKFFRLSSKAHN